MDGRTESLLATLKGLFGLRKNARVNPPTCCRTHTDRVAHFKCRDSIRPLCEECAPEKKFGQTVIRVCGHCGGTATELVAPDLSYAAGLTPGIPPVILPVPERE